MPCAPTGGVALKKSKTRAAGKAKTQPRGRSPCCYGRNALTEVRDVLAKLKVEKAQLLLLRHSGLTYQEIAQAMQLDVHSVGTKTGAGRGGVLRTLRTAPEAPAQDAAVTDCEGGAMKHGELGTGMLRAYLDGQLDSGQAAAVDQHLKSCSCVSSESWPPCVTMRHVCGTALIDCRSCPRQVTQRRRGPHFKRSGRSGWKGAESVVPGPEIIASWVRALASPRLSWS